MTSSWEYTPSGARGSTPTASARSAAVPRSGTRRSPRTRSRPRPATVRGPDRTRQVSRPAESSRAPGTAAPPAPARPPRAVTAGPRSSPARPPRPPTSPRPVCALLGVIGMRNRHESQQDRRLSRWDHLLAKSAARTTSGLRAERSAAWSKRGYAVDAAPDPGGGIAERHAALPHRPEGLNDAGSSQLFIQESHPSTAGRPSGLPEETDVIVIGCRQADPAPAPQTADFPERHLKPQGRSLRKEWVGWTWISGSTRRGSPGS
jgi:hypothetical protein